MANRVTQVHRRGCLYDRNRIARVPRGQEDLKRRLIPDDSRPRHLAGILAVAGPLPALAQAAGTLTGMARDDRRGLPGRHGHAHRIALAVPRTSVTNEHGGYEIDGLPRGLYVVEATLAGFRPEVAEIAVDGMATHHFVLSVAAFPSGMTVTATKTGAADIQATPFDHRTLRRLRAASGNQKQWGAGGLRSVVTVS